VGLGVLDPRDAPLSGLWLIAGLAAVFPAKTSTWRSAPGALRRIPRWALSRGAAPPCKGPAECGCAALAGDAALNRALPLRRPDDDYVRLRGSSTHHATATAVKISQAEQEDLNEGELRAVGEGLLAHHGGLWPSDSTPRARAGRPLPLAMALLITRVLKTKKPAGGRGGGHCGIVRKWADQGEAVAQRT